VHLLPVTESTWHNGLIQKISRVVLSESHLLLSAFSFFGFKNKEIQWKFPYIRVDTFIS